MLATKFQHFDLLILLDKNGLPVYVFQPEAIGELEPTLISGFIQAIQQFANEFFVGANEFFSIHQGENLIWLYKGAQFNLAVISRSVIHPSLFDVLKEFLSLFENGYSTYLDGLGSVIPPRVEQKLTKKLLGLLSSKVIKPYLIPFKNDNTPPKENFLSVWNLIDGKSLVSDIHEKLDRSSEEIDLLLLSLLLQNKIDFDLKLEGDNIILSNPNISRYFSPGTPYYELVSRDIPLEATTYSIIIAMLNKNYTLEKLLNSFLPSDHENIKRFLKLLIFQDLAHFPTEEDLSFFYAMELWQNLLLQLRMALSPETFTDLFSELSLRNNNTPLQRRLFHMPQAVQPIENELIRADMTDNTSNSCSSQIVVAITILLQTLSKHASSKEVKKVLTPYRDFIFSQALDIYESYKLGILEKIILWLEQNQ